MSRSTLIEHHSLDMSSIDRIVLVGGPTLTPNLLRDSLATELQRGYRHSPSTR